MAFRISLSTLLSLFSAGVLVALISQNTRLTVDVDLVNWHWHALPMWDLLLLSAVLGGLTVFFVCLSWQRGLRQDMLKSTLRQEKAEVSAASQNDQVEALQRKVETLEKALEKALQRSQ